MRVRVHFCTGAEGELSKLHKSNQTEKAILLKVEGGQQVAKFTKVTKQKEQNCEFSFQWGKDPSAIAATFEDGLYVQVNL